MPVADHAVHPANSIGADHRYGCHNKPRPTSQIVHYAPNGYALDHLMTDRSIQAAIHLVAIPFSMSTECRYDMSTTDPHCEGCDHVGGGELYAKSLRGS